MQRVPAAVSKSKIHNPNYLKHSKNVLTFAMAHAVRSAVSVPAGS